MYRYKIYAKKRIFSVKKLLPFCVLLSVFSVLPAQTDSSLVWQLAFLHNVSGRLESLPISQVAQLKDGDQFKLKISADDDACCYVVFEQGDGSVAVLCNAKLKAFETQALPGDADDALFVLSPPDGTDKIHVIVSDRPVKSVELLLAKLEKEGSAPAISRGILDEIARIKQNLSPVTEKPSKPAVMGAATRAIGTPSASASTEFSGASLYVKTIRIRH